MGLTTKQIGEIIITLVCIVTLVAFATIYSNSNESNITNKTNGLFNSVKSDR